MQQLHVFQSLWAMESSSPHAPAPSLDASVERIKHAGFDGLSVFLSDPAYVRQAAELVRANSLHTEGVCFPTTIEDLKPALEMASTLGVQHLNVHAKPRTSSLSVAAGYIEGWLRLCEQVPFPVYFETHRNCLTNDLYLTLELLRRVPQMQLVGDLSHYLVAEQPRLPLGAEDNQRITTILERCAAFHGRVGSTQQVQVELSLPHHRPWLELFMGWWGDGFRHWKARSPADAVLAFTCELGPQPYAVAGADGHDLSDRWAEAIQLKDHIRALWPTLA